MRGYRLSRVGNKTEIWLPVFVERSRHADDDGIHVRQGRKVRCRRKTSRTSALDLGRWNSTDVRSTGGQGSDLTLVDVKTSHSKLRLGIKQSKRQSHITETYHADPRLARINSVLEL